MYREERRLGWKGWGLLAGSFVQGQDLVTYYEAAEALQHHETAGPIIRRAIETEFGHGSVEVRGAAGVVARGGAPAQRKADCHT